MVVNLTDLDRVLKEEVDRPLDHRNLNRDVPGVRDDAADRREPRGLDLEARRGPDRAREVAVPPRAPAPAADARFAVEIEE